MYPPLPGRNLQWKVAVLGSTDGEWNRKIGCMVEDDFFSVAFMFSTIYLRLEGKVPPPQDWDVAACTDGDSD